MRLDHRKLRAIMAMRGYQSVVELSKDAGVHAVTIYRAINGGGFRASVLDKLATALDCNPIDLIDTSKYPKPIDFPELNDDQA